MSLTKQIRYLPHLRYATVTFNGKFDGKLNFFDSIRLTLLLLLAKIGITFSLASKIIPFGSAQNARLKRGGPFARSCENPLIVQTDDRHHKVWIFFYPLND